MTDQILRYETKRNIQECIKCITQAPQEYSCKWGTPLWYEATQISDTQVLIIFKGGQFRKIMRTQYLMELLPEENLTQIIMRFQKEMLGLPPMTPPGDIDLCMQQKLNATRIL